MRDMIGGVFCIRTSLSRRSSTPSGCQTMETIIDQSIFTPNSSTTTAHPAVNKTLLPVFRPSSPSMDEYEFCGVIGPPNVEGMIACPCCNRLRNEDRETLNEPVVSNRGSLLITESSSSEEADDDVLPGVLARGVEYHPKRILVEGWVHKKGTGKDFFGSRGWKPRWARLALAKVDGYEVDVPLFLIYWYRSSTHPSTVILLESTVVLAIDKDEKLWHSCRFEIRHVKKTDTTEVQTTRTFTVPKKERDMWVCAISQALLSLEKQKANLRKAGIALESDPTTISPRGPIASDGRPRSPFYDSIWSCDKFITPETPSTSVRRMGSPPASPRPSSKRPLPRHDVLAGESLA